MTAAHPRKHTRRRWTEADNAALRRLYPDLCTDDVARIMGRQINAVYRHAAVLGLKKTTAYLASEQAGRIQRGRQLPSMVAHQFKRGHTPWNDGKKGLDIGGKATRFAPGAKPPNTLPVGSYRINGGGHLQRKIGDAPGSSSKCWRGVAELVWVAAHGPVPPKHLVVFKPGQFTNVLDLITLARIECISMAENARRNGPHTKHPELARLVQLKGAITRQVNRITREAQEAAQT